MRKFNEENEEKYRFAPYRSKTPPINSHTNGSKKLKRKRHTTESDLSFKRLKIMEFLGKSTDIDVYHDLERTTISSPAPSNSSCYITRDLNYSDTDSVCSTPSIQCLFDELIALHKLLHENKTNDDLPRTGKVYEKDYVVEKIIRINIVGQHAQFFVKWKNFPSEQNTWEPTQHLEECKPFSDFMTEQYKTYEKELDKIMHTIIPNDFTNLNDTEIITKISIFSVYDFQADLLLLALFELNNRRGKTLNAITERVKYGLGLIPFMLKRLDQLREIAKWESNVNSTEILKNLHVENNVDYEIPPTNFRYTNNVIPADGIVIPDDPPIGCDCNDDGECDTKSNCCGKASGSKFAYSKNRSIIVKQGTPVFECNKRCKCGPSCRNRIVQQGRRHSLLIFKTSNGCGWGVRTNKAIARGQFIAEYVGELITCDEAEKRGKEYDAVGCTYLFDLDFNENDNLYSLDAAKCGNVSRFINHSCNPNLGVWAVWTDCLDLDLPKICLFALRRIEAGEEITFDYMNGNLTRARKPRSSNQSSQSKVHSDESIETKDAEEDQNNEKLAEGFECKCGAENCQKFLF